MAVIGRPNVGKSSLVNRLLGDERLLVSEVSGTTRDAVDTVLEKDGVHYKFVDTAGIRRKGRTDRGPEVLSVVMARRYLEHADICLLVVDADEGITRQDAHVGGYAWEAGRAVILVVNKWDLVSDRAEAGALIEGQAAQNLKFMRHSPGIFLSALTGKGVHRLFPAMREVHKAITRRSPPPNSTTHAGGVGPTPSGHGRQEGARDFLLSQVQTRHRISFSSPTSRPHRISPICGIWRTFFARPLVWTGVPIRVIIRGRKN